MNNLGITTDIHQQIINVISSFNYISRAVVFGSRAIGTYKKYSDIDICLFGELNTFDTEHVRTILNDLNIIYEFDVICYHEIKTPPLRDHIDRVGKEIYQRKLT